MRVTVYGFRSCDTVKKALAWLDARGIDHDFVDYRRQALDPDTVDRWFDSAGWEAVLNRNSTTFRNMPEEMKASLDATRARSMILAETNLIKRPVLDVDGTVTAGFRPALWEKMLPIP